MAKILIVDDSSFSRRTLRKLLEQAGHEVIEAENGLLAIERYALEQPALVLLDMNMGGMHGLDVLTQLRSLDQKACVIVATADVQSSTRSLAAAEGAHSFMPKPFSAEQVRAMVDAALTGDC